jgi:tyrosine-protein phosphatase YwqE
MKTVKWKVSQIQKIRKKENLGLKALKRAVMIELCILVGIFSAFIQGVNERFHDLLGWNYVSVTSLMIWTLYEVLMEKIFRLIN